MKKLAMLITLALLLGCQLTPVTQPTLPEPETEQQAEPMLPAVEEEEPEQILIMTLDDTAIMLAAWLNYRQQLLLDPEPERERLANLSDIDAVALLQMALLNLHPDMPYVSRFRVQTQLSEMLTELPPTLAAIVGWDLAFNQKLLEAESAVSAVTRLNAQQQDALERLQKTNRDLQKKIDALTQIEAELNQQPLVENTNGANNGQG